MGQQPVSAIIMFKFLWMLLEIILLFSDFKDNIVHPSPRKLNLNTGKPAYIKSLPSAPKTAYKFEQL